MSIAEMESSLRRAAEYGILALRMEADQYRTQAARERIEGHDGLSAAFAKLAQDRDAELRELEVAYRTRYKPEVEA